MSDLERSKHVLDRRSFLKMIGSAGATGVVMSVATPLALGHVAAAPAAVPVGAQDAPEGMKAVYIHTEGPMGNLNFQPGDAGKWVPEAALNADAADVLAELGAEKLKDIYRRMYTNYRWETMIKDLNVEGKEALGSGHMYIGEEAIANGVMAAMREDDFIASTHRGHGHLIAKGGDLNLMTAEFFAKTSGANKGYGGSMHLTEVKKGILGMNGIVGAGWYMAAGAAYGIQVRGTDQVAVAFAGEGASNSVWFFSAVRNATMYSLPAIFVIENNFQNITVPAAHVIPTKCASDYVAGLGIPTTTVDGNDVAAVYAVAKAAVDRARAGEGPSVIEGITYRWYDHSGFAGATYGVDAAWGLPYRSDEEVKAWMARAPWIRYEAFLLDKGFATQAELAAIQGDVQAAVDASVEFAKAGEYPTGEMGLQNVYATGSVPARQFIDAQVPTDFAMNTFEFKRQVAMYESLGPEAQMA